MTRQLSLKMDIENTSISRTGYMNLKLFSVFFHNRGTQYLKKVKSFHFFFFSPEILACLLITMQRWFGSFRILIYYIPFQNHEKVFTR